MDVIPPASRSQLVPAINRQPGNALRTDHFSGAGSLKRQAALRLEHIARQIGAIDARARALIAADPSLARRFAILASISGVGEATAVALIADMPELGEMDAKQAASLAGLAPVARQSGTWRGKSAIRGGRAHLR